MKAAQIPGELEPWDDLCVLAMRAAVRGRQNNHQLFSDQRYIFLTEQARQTRWGECKMKAIDYEIFNLFTSAVPHSSPQPRLWAAWAQAFRGSDMP